MHYFLTSIFILSLNLSYGQEFVYPSVRSEGRSIPDFLPPGWMLLDTARGDLNKDGTPDAAIIIQHIDSVSIVDKFGDTTLTQPRILFMLSKHSDSSFTLMEQSNSFIMKHDNANMDDPYQRLSIRNGFLEIQFQFFYHTGSWEITNLTYKFRYQQKQFILVRSEYYALHRSTHDFDAYAYDFLTKKKSSSQGNIDKPGETTIKKRINVPVLKSLKDFKEPLTWEVEPGVFL